MTPEDLAQIAAIVAAAEERAAQRLDRQFAAAEERAAQRLDRTMEALTSNLSEVRQELVTRLDAIERRTERTEINVNSILMQLAGISRSLTVGEQLTSKFAANQGGQQRALDDLAARVSRIERALNLDRQ